MLLHMTRHQRILALLGDHGIVSARELRTLLGVTAMTVWRDLCLLEELGLLRRVRGGAQMISPGATEPDFEAKGSAEAEAKSRIAARAVREFVYDRCILGLEGGTTIAEVIPFLPETRISVLTNSLPVASRLRKTRPLVPVQLSGGSLSPVSGNLTGPEAIRSLKRQSADVCFLSATGLDLDRGLTDPNPLEIEVKRVLAAISQRVVLLLDHSKFGVSSAAVAIHPKRLHAVVTDGVPPKEYVTRLRRLSVRLIVAHPA